MRISVNPESPFYWIDCPNVQVVANGLIQERVQEACEEEGWFVVRQPDGGLFKWSGARVEFVFTKRDGSPWEYADAREAVERFQSRNYTYGSRLRQRLFYFASDELAEELLEYLLEAKRKGTPLSQELFDFVVHPLLERAYPFETKEQAERFFEGK